MTGPSSIIQGPCQAWTDEQQILDCGCPGLDTDTDFDSLAEQASAVLYILSGHKYPGICEATVRPCAGGSYCWTPRSDWRAGTCHCGILSSIRLAGYPVREILEVTIDGATVDPSDYRLDGYRDLVRLNGDRWPHCQRLDLDEGVGTFFVFYRYGQEPPLGAAGAAAQLACAIAKACPGSGFEDDCELPAGTVRVSRLGITIDTQALGLWLIGTMKTGMPLVDMFLSVYGAQRQRRPALMVPEQDPWPLRVVG